MTEIRVPKPLCFPFPKRFGKNDEIPEIPGKWNNLQKSSCEMCDFAREMLTFQQCVLGIKKF